MRKLKKYLSRVRFVYRRSSNLTKCVVIATLLLSTAALIALRVRLVETREALNAAKVKAVALEQENKGISKDIENKDTVEGVKKYAYEVLDYVEPGAVIYEPEE